MIVGCIKYRASTSSPETENSLQFQLAMSQAPCYWLYICTHTHQHACTRIHTRIGITTSLALFHVYVWSNTDEVNAVTALYPWQWLGSCALWGSCKTEGLIRGSKAQLQWAPPCTRQGSCDAPHLRHWRGQGAFYMQSKHEARREELKA